MSDTENELLPGLEGLPGPMVAQLLADSLSHDYWILGPDRRYVLQNAHSRNAWGDLVGKSLAELEVSASDRSQWEDNDSRAFEGEAVFGEFERVVDGQRRRFADVLVPLEIDGHVHGVVGSNLTLPETIDVSYLQRRLEEPSDSVAMVQSLATELLQLSGIFAVIGGRASTAMDASRPGTVDDALRVVQAAAKRGADVTRQLLTGVRPSESEPIDLNTVVSAAVRSAEREHPATARLEFFGHARAPRVDVEASVIDGVMQKLIANSLAALPGQSGTIVVAVDEPSDDAPPHLAGMACISVDDDGCGIERERLRRVFEPGHSTTPGAAGLGLWIVRRVVSGLGGRIRVRSRVGQGTRVEVLLPLAE